MSLETKSQELKDIISTYDTRWFIGDLSGLMKAIANNLAEDQLGELSSPLRQLYFLAGLLVTSDDQTATDITHSKEKWDQIIKLLNEIEFEYDKLFFPSNNEEITPEWKRVRKVAMPSFLAYFNQGPLNYEEQTINWVRDLFTQLDDIIEQKTGYRTESFLQFYQNIDALIQRKFRGFTSPDDKDLFNKEWLNYTNIKMGVSDDAPEPIKQMGEEKRPLYTFMADHGIINRFHPEDLISDGLTLEQINGLLPLLTCRRTSNDYLYYTATSPGNPLFDTPIVDVGDNMFQVFEAKQVVHAIENLLETTCAGNLEETAKFVEKKGKLLEQRIVELFSKFLKGNYQLFTSYYVDGCEQDILFLWKGHALIIEAKGYKLNEPFRDPDKAFTRIKNDFKKCIQYGFDQTRRVARKFVDQVPLKIEDKNGNILEVIDTTKYQERDFSIIVNLRSFGQIQNDLSTLLEIDNDSAYPWVVKLDDLEVFLLTLMAQKKNPNFLINYMKMREELHSKLICGDELEVCAGYLSGVIKDSDTESEKMLVTSPELPEVFDEQYRKGMGFKNEKLLAEKKSNKYLFWG